MRVYYSYIGDIYGSCVVEIDLTDIYIYALELIIICEIDLIWLYGLWYIYMCDLYLYIIHTFIHYNLPTQTYYNN